MAESAAVNDESLLYWLDILPLMNEQQRTKLRGIFIWERKELTKLARAKPAELLELEGPWRQQRIQRWKLIAQHFRGKTGKRPLEINPKK